MIDDGLCWCVQATTVLQRTDEALGTWSNLVCLSFESPLKNPSYVHFPVINDEHPLTCERLRAEPIMAIVVGKGSVERVVEHRINDVLLSEPGQNSCCPSKARAQANEKRWSLAGIVRVDETSLWFCGCAERMYLCMGEVESKGRPNAKATTDIDLITKCRPLLLDRKEKYTSMHFIHSHKQGNDGYSVSVVHTAGWTRFL